MIIALAAAIAEWAVDLHETTADSLTPEDVISAFNDITIASLVRPASMPTLLRNLYADAAKRNQRGHENFSIAGLRYTVNKSLEELRALV